MDPLVVQCALSALVYFVAAWFSRTYNPMNWDFLVIVIAVGVIWNTWDPS